MSDKVELHPSIAAMKDSHKAAMAYKADGEFVAKEGEVGFAALPAFVDANGKKAQVKLDDAIIEAVKGGAKTVALTPEMVEVSTRFQSDDIVASGAAFGELAVEQMKANKELDLCTYNGTMGNAVVKHSMARSKTYGIGDNETTKYGVLRSDLITKSSGTRGAFNRVKKHLNAIAEEALK